MKTSKITPELRDRAMRMVLEHWADHSSKWATIESIAPKIGFTPQALVIWIQRTEIDQGPREGVTNVYRLFGSVANKDIETRLVYARLSKPSG